jgi:hypothetical protein
MFFLKQKKLNGRGMTICTKITDHYFTALIIKNSNNGIHGTVKDEMFHKPKYNNK